MWPHFETLRWTGRRGLEQEGAGVICIEGVGFACVCVVVVVGGGGSLL